MNNHKALVMHAFKHGKFEPIKDKLYGITSQENGVYIGKVKSTEILASNLRVVLDGRVYLPLNAQMSKWHRVSRVAQQYDDVLPEMMAKIINLMHGTEPVGRNL